jgi:hypothetical protein
MAVKVQHWKGACWVIIHHAGRRKTKRIGDKETAAITLRVYAHWLADASTYTLVNGLDDAASDVTQATPTTPDEEVQRTLSRFDSVVSRGGIEPPTRRLRVCCSAN